MEHNNTPVNLILNSGKKLPFNWYEFRGRYYRIFNNEIVLESNDLRTDEEIGFFIYRHLINPSILVIVIKTYVGFIYNTAIEDVKVFNDGFFICNTEDGLHKELRMSDTQIIIADDIYRLSNGIFVGVSNGIHYIVDIDSGEMKPVSESQIRYNEEKSVFESITKEGNWNEINI